MTDKDDWEVISSYSRKQAFADGVLVDLSADWFGEMCKEAGFRFPLAMTSTAFAEVIGFEPLPAGQDQNGRLWDVLMVLKAAIRQNRNSNRQDFAVSVFDGKRHNKIELYCLCGPSDSGEPCLTVMLPTED